MGFTKEEQADILREQLEAMFAQFIMNLRETNWEFPCNAEITTNVDDPEEADDGSYTIDFSGCITLWPAQEDK